MYLPLLHMSASNLQEMTNKGKIICQRLLCCYENSIDPHNNISKRTVQLITLMTALFDLFPFNENLVYLSLVFDL